MQKKPALELVVDTNVLGRRDHIPKLVLDAFAKQLTEVRKKADVTVALPLLVVEEVIHQKTDLLLDGLASTAKGIRLIKSLTGTELPAPPSSEDLAKIIDQAIRSEIAAHSFKELKYPVPEAMLARISHAAVWRKGPFKNDAPSAFKDALIAAQAILHRQHTRGSQVVFLTNDAEAGKLELFTKEEIGDMLTLPSMEALSAVPDQLTKKNTERLVRLRELGKARFYYPYGITSLYQLWGLDTELRQLAGKPLSYAGLATSYQLGLSAEQNQFPPTQWEYTGTEVIGQEGDHIFYRSDIMYSFNERIGFTILSSTLKTERFSFSIFWNAREKDGALVDEQKESVKLMDKSTTETALPIPLFSNISNVSGLSTGTAILPVWTKPFGDPWRPLSGSS